MLRITRVESPVDGPTIKLEGKLLAAWASEIKTACQMAANGRGKPRLDLSAVTFADATGVRLLEELSACGTRLVNCSPFIATPLHREVR